MVKILEHKAEIVKDPEPESKIDEPKVDKPEPGSDVIDKLVSPPERISFRPIEVEELPIKILVNLSIELTLEPVPPLAAMEVSFILKSPDVYDLL